MSDELERSIGPYRALILEHARAPRNRGPLEDPDLEGEVHNPLCGDRVALSLSLSGDRVRRAQFTAEGCAFVTAGASLLTEWLRGRPLTESRTRSAEALELFAGGAGRLDLGKGTIEEGLEALLAIREPSARARCASLPWEALARALETISPSSSA